MLLQLLWTGLFRTQDRQAAKQHVEILGKLWVNCADWGETLGECECVEG